jgi:tRNA(fMet)-specific endonuclease VapC
MPLYLLDINIISDLVSNPQGRVYKAIETIGEDAIATSIIVAAELRFGARKRGSSALSERVNLILNSMNVVSWEAPVDAIYSEVRNKLEAAGTPIGANDTLIAAHALCLGRVLVTHNVREFKRVQGLHVVDWLA